MAYSDKVPDQYENPRNAGSFEKSEQNIGTGMVGVPACGDVMKLQIRVNDDGIIEDAVVRTYGCSGVIASHSLLTQWTRGKSLDEASAIRNSQIVEELRLPPGRIHYSVPAKDTIDAAIENYKQQPAPQRARY